MAAKNTLHWDILDKKRLRIIPELRFLKQAGFYLAGGTALALQIRHRISVDFDFYAPREFDAGKILLEMEKSSRRVTAIHKAENTLIAKIEGIDISFFTYRYALIKPAIETEHLTLASLEDIAAMKLIAIVQRGISRDFIDMYFLIQRLGLSKIFGLTRKKYPSFNEYLGLQALTYFGDAEDVSTERKAMLIERLDWKDVKDFLVREAKKFKAILAERK